MSPSLWSIRLVVVAVLVLPGPAPAPRAAQGQEADSSKLKANLDLPFDAGSDSENEVASTETIVFYGQAYEGTAFFYCCERVSGCDGGAAFRRMQKEVVKSLSQLSDRAELGLVFFDASVLRFPVSGQPVGATPAIKSSATQVTLKVQPGLGCCAKPALVAALDFASRSTARQKVIFYLGEGYTYCGGADLEAYAAEVLNSVKAKNLSRIPIHTIGTGSGHEVNEPWLKRLAAENGGTYRRIVQ